MTRRPPPPERQSALAAALRANLRRRKPGATAKADPPSREQADEADDAPQPADGAKDG